MTEKPDITLLDTTKESEELFQVTFRLQKWIKEFETVISVIGVPILFSSLFYIISHDLSLSSWFPTFVIWLLLAINVVLTSCYFIFYFIRTHQIRKALEEGEKLHWGLVVLGDKNRFWDRDYSLPTPAKSAMSLYLEQEKKWKHIKIPFGVYFSMAVFIAFLLVLLISLDSNITTTRHYKEKQHLQQQIDSLQRENKRLLEENKQLKNK